MDAIKNILEGVIGKFVCDDAGKYKGQCPQLPRYFVNACGGNWQGATGNGNVTVDYVVKNGGYYGQGKGGEYRIASCDVAGSPYGHTWVEIKVNGQWTIYEQNINRAGTKSANFGVGTVYSVSKTTQPGSWRKNIEYAGHPAIDNYIKAHTPQPTPPAPQPQPAGFKVGDKVVPTRLVDYNGTPLVQYDKTYTITQINGDRAVLSAPRNGKMVVWAAMNTKDIKKA